MSGTSLDGLDVALIRFSKENQWTFKIEESVTYPYSDQWIGKLTFNTQLTSEELLALDHDYGILLGSMILRFLDEYSIDPSEITLIASHGQTLYHKPEKGYTKQIGNGPEIYTSTGITTICDFRSQDVAFGGQGAPLVPIGDQELFGEYEACMNLGGFANISFKDNNKRFAFDICPVNYVLNYLTLQHSLAYDSAGDLSKQGTPNTKLIQQLNNIDFYKVEAPKTLGAEWVNDYFFPILREHPLSLKDGLRSLVEHISDQIANILNSINYLPYC